MWGHRGSMSFVFEMGGGGNKEGGQVRGRSHERWLCYGAIWQSTHAPIPSKHQSPSPLPQTSQFPIFPLPIPLTLQRECVIQSSGRQRLGETSLLKCGPSSMLGFCKELNKMWMLKLPGNYHRCYCLGNEVPIHTTYPAIQYTPAPPRPPIVSPSLAPPLPSQGRFPGA